MILRLKGIIWRITFNLHQGQNLPYFVCVCGFVFYFISFLSVFICVLSTNINQKSNHHIFNHKKETINIPVTEMSFRMTLVSSFYLCFDSYPAHTCTIFSCFKRFDWVFFLMRWCLYTSPFRDTCTCTVEAYIFIGLKFRCF